MSDPFKTLTGAFAKARTSLAFKVETVALEFTENLIARMKSRSVTRAELARRIGATRPYVSKILNNPGNLTFESLVKIADAVDCDLRTHLVPRDCDGMWINVLKERVDSASAAAQPPATAPDDLAAAA